MIGPRDILGVVNDHEARHAVSHEKRWHVRAGCTSEKWQDSLKKSEEWKMRAEIASANKPSVKVIASLAVLFLNEF